MAEQAFQPDWFSKPGDTVATLMAKNELNRKDLAARIDASLDVVKGLIAGVTRIDSDLADRLAAAIGGSPDFWLRRQEGYDQSLDRAAARIPAVEADAWLKTFPSKEMAQQGWVLQSKDKREATRNYLAYFGVGSPEEWTKKYTDSLSDYSFRTSTSFASNLGALTAWLRQGEIEAASIVTARWDLDHLKSLLPEIRKLSRWKSPGSFIPHLQELCATAGVALVVVKAPAGCKASGATRFLSDEKAMIILSFRHLSDDHFWFTLFHEIGHLILHGKSKTFVDSETDSQDEREAEANEFAAASLIPADRRHELESLPARRDSIIRFAVSVGVGSGVIVGQMQHLGLIGPHQMNFLKRRYQWPAIYGAMH